MICSIYEYLSNDRVELFVNILEKYFSVDFKSQVF